MAGVAHDPKFAKKVGIPQSVGKEFNQADVGTGILKRPVKEEPAAKAEAKRGSVSNDDLLKVKSKAKRIIKLAGLT